MKSFVIETDMEVGIDGMLANETKTASILKKFLVINLQSFLF